MPEPNYIPIYLFSTQPPKKSPVIKCSGGIGDTDGFPAFDVDSDVYGTKDDSRWGFLITGGADFHMPLTVFQVTPDSVADKGGIRLGDVILEINEKDVTNYTLAEAHDQIDASPKKIHFLVKSMEEDPQEMYEVGEEKSIVLRIPKPLPPPKVASIEKRLRDMQRKLSEIAEIPKILSSTLATVSQTFDKLAMNGPITSGGDNKRAQNGGQYQQQQKRKMSYDEDAYDYELSDDGEDDQDADANDDDDQFNAKEAYQRLKQHLARQRKSKDVTPESDYASENNYPLNNQDDNLSQIDDDDDDDDDDDVEEEEDEYNMNETEVEENIKELSDFDGQEQDKRDAEDMNKDMNEDICQVFNLKLFLTPSGGHNNKSNKRKCDDDLQVVTEHEEDEDEEDEEDEEDFLTTTFTMNLRNKPKLEEVNDYNEPEANIDGKIENHLDCKSDGLLNDTDVMEHQESPASPCSNKSEDTQQHSEEWLHRQTKLDKFWPWADREKIIYKQSTCHLVPKKPLGLIGQRIHQLAKQNLLEHLNPATKSTK